MSEESISQIIDGLWVGGEGSSACRQFFKKEDIGAVVNCTPSVQHNFFDLGVEYLRIPAGDSEDPEDMKLMKNMMPMVVEWIKLHHQDLDKNVLIHCHFGINRSATFTCAYIMKYYGLRYKEAVEFLIARRQNIFYNGDRPTFKQLLIDWEQQCNY